MIVAALDFSKISDKVLATAVELARALSSELLLLHVAAPEPDFIGYSPGPQTVRDSRAEALRHQHRELQERAEALRAQGLEAQARLVQGSTVETILEEAGRHAARFVVVGSHARGLIGRTLLGSVSEGVARGARCPVLIVPPGEETPAAS